MIKFVIKIVGIALAISCICSCSSSSDNINCKVISESNGKALAKASLQKYLTKLVSNGKALTDGEKTIDSNKFQSIDENDINYEGMPSMEPGSDKIYDFSIKNIESVKFSVALYDNCNTETRWVIL